MKNSRKTSLIVIAGPTAVGKTDLSIRAAKHFKTEIISADSRQIFKEMSIGTAKPLAHEMSGVKHHFIDSHSIFENYNAGKFEVDAIDLINELSEKYQILVMTGGSGLYVKAVCEGFDAIPEGENKIRNELNNEFSVNGIESLLAELKVKDPEYFLIIDKSNRQRVIRALEVIRSTGHPFSSYRKQFFVPRQFNVIKIGIERPREELYDRINKRVDLMLQNGLLEEVKSLYSKRSLNALQTVGYQEFFDFLEGKITLDEAIELVKRNSRRFAKRQLTWFKRDPEMQWFNADADEEILEYIKTVLNKKEA